ncbi:MAG: hypothetical protein AVDCRST_MAG19-120 [uncultured Thermomicrobiales bacterium]|uniref:Uncharacterized protein n=1 Tax=uncultured Thermomicrobiales bacterium TaxID=1645740 RepID=A0A6J4U8H1_9BACT|nr:MAG: hypothetical protein AVDCRST_MAG19-120 [uncultured Thermomicrobiales bacterium]
MVTETGKATTAVEGLGCHRGRSGCRRGEVSEEAERLRGRRVTAADRTPTPNEVAQHARTVIDEAGDVSEALDRLS